MIDIEEKIECMIAAGQKIVDAAIMEYEPVAILAGFSGGNDSIVTTHFAVENYPSTVFYADTMVGLDPTRAHIRRVVDRFGWPFRAEKAVAEGPPTKMRKGGKLVPFDAAAVCPAGHWVDGETAYEEYCLNFGFPGRGKPQHARMYQRLKERQLRRVLKDHRASKAGRKVLIISGIRADESSIRAGYKRETSEGYFGDVWVNPFYWFTKVDFASYRDEFGLPGNSVTRKCGISGECCCGTFAKTDERRILESADPGFASYLAGLESRVNDNGFPWGWGESPPKWWVEKQRGQQFMFDMEESPRNQPMCVGCASGRRS